MTSDSWQTDKNKTILNQMSQGRGGLMHIFNDSLFGRFKYLVIRFRQIFRKLHLDLYLPLFLLMLSAALTAILLNNNRQNAKCSMEGDCEYVFYKDFGSLVIATITIMFTMGNMHRDFHLNKRTRASDYIRLWYSDEMQDVIKAVGEIYDVEFWNSNRTVFNKELFDQPHSVIAEYKKTADGVIALQAAQSRILERLYREQHRNHGLLSFEKHKNRSDKDAVNRLLAFFEHMGQDVKRHVVDSDYLKDFFYSIALNHYELLRKYIEYLQVDRSNRITCCNFIYLAQAWEKEGSLPELPRICIRPLVLTASDLDHVTEIRNLT